MKAFHWLESSFSARISSNLRRYTNAELAGRYFMYEAAQENGEAVQTMLHGTICRIAEHLGVFIGSCARVDYFMLRGVIRALEDIAEFLQRKKQYYA